MKKLFALVLAVAMVLAVATVAMAKVEGVPAVGDIEVDKVLRVDGSKVKVRDSGDYVWYGDTAALLLLDENGNPVTEYDSVKSVRVSYDWKGGMNSDQVVKSEIVKKKVHDAAAAEAVGHGVVANEYYYFLCISTKANPNKTADTDIMGKMTIKGGSGSAKITEEIPAEFGITLKFPDTASDATIEEDPKVFEFDDSKADKLDEDEEFEFEFSEFEDNTFTVNTVGQGKLVISADADYDEEIGAKYPQANLDFFNGNGASFNKTGELFLKADEGSFLYVVRDGVLSAVKAEYDEYDEGFYVKTRTIGKYVISDVELDVSASAPSVDGTGDPTVEQPSIDVPTINPGTGAVA